MATNKSKSMDKMPARKMPEGFKMELKATPKAKAKATPKATSKSTNGSNTKPFNSRLMTPKELTGLPKKATPKATAKPKPMTEAQKQAKAMDKLMEKRKAVSKKTGSWPNYNTN
jgi:hypothetical protein